MKTKTLLTQIKGKLWWASIVVLQKMGKKKSKKEIPKELCEFWKDRYQA